MAVAAVLIPLIPSILEVAGKIFSPPKQPDLRPLFDQIRKAQDVAAGRAEENHKRLQECLAKLSQLQQREPARYKELKFQLEGERDQLKNAQSKLEDLRRQAQQAFPDHEIVPEDIISKVHL